MSGPSLSDHPDLPSFCIFSTRRVLSFIYCTRCFEFSFPPSSLQLPLFRPPPSLPWTLCTGLLLVSPADSSPVSNHPQYARKRSLRDQMPPVASIHPRAKVEVSYVASGIRLSFSSCLLSSSGCNLRSISTERLVFLKPLLVMSPSGQISHTSQTPVQIWFSLSQNDYPLLFAIIGVLHTPWGHSSQCTIIVCTLFHTEDYVSFLTVFSVHSTQST